MGLAGRKVKQRFDNDPRNLTWADDASKFGQAYLSKLGWDPSKGLGVAGDGMKSHITVSQRLNLLGLGAGTKQGAEDIAWKQNRDYELVLKRLNATANGGDVTSITELEAVGVVAEGGFVMADPGKEFAVKEQEDAEDDMKEKSKKKKKRKNEEEKEDGGKDKSEKKKSKKRRKHQDEPESSNDKEQTSSTPSAPPAITTPIARPMAHRARFLKSKRMALENPTAMLEILGIASSSASPSSSYPSTPAAGMSTNASPSPESVFSSLTTSSILSGDMSPTENVSEAMEKLTTSTISMADYFKEKLAAKSKPSPLSRSVTREDTEDELDAPRRGLGASNVDMEDSSGNVSSGLGLGSGMKFSALMGFAPPKAVTTDTSSSSTPVVPAEDQRPVASSEKGKEKEKKKSKKKKDGSDKERRCEQIKETKMSGADLEPQDPQSSDVNDRVQDESESREGKKKKKKKSRKEE